MKLLIFILIIPCVSAGIVINEIMYNPSKEQGEDKELEWVELYSDEETNLSDFYFNNFKLEDSVVKGYFIIARNKSYFLDYYGLDLMVIEARFILSNKGGYVNLTYLNESYLVPYNNDFANGNIIMILQMVMEKLWN